MSRTPDKVELRKRAAELLAARTSDNRIKAAAAAATKLKENDYWRESRSVLGYLSFGSELSIDNLLRVALADGKFVFVPRVIGGQLVFHRIMSLEEKFSKGVFGIREPAEKNLIWDFHSSPGPVLVLVPGLAFTLKGARLGRGGGYYDRFINRIRLEALTVGKRAPLCVGFAGRDQILESVPTEDHDEFLDGLITDTYSGLF